MDDANGAERQRDGGTDLAEGVDHLQRAARELLAAARSFLDVVEQVVEDDERLAGAASSIVELVGRGVGTATNRDLAGSFLGGLTGREPSWLRNDPDHPDAADPDHTAAADHRGHESDLDDDPFFGDASVEVTAPTNPAPSNPAPKKAAAKKAAAKNAAASSAVPRTRRVTRISVD